MHACLCQKQKQNTGDTTCMLVTKSRTRVAHQWCHSIQNKGGTSPFRKVVWHTTFSEWWCKTTIQNEWWCETTIQNGGVPPPFRKVVWHHHSEWNHHSGRWCTHHPWWCPHHSIVTSGTLGRKMGGGVHKKKQQWHTFQGHLVVSSTRAARVKNTINLHENLRILCASKCISDIFAF